MGITDQEQDEQDTPSKEELFMEYSLFYCTLLSARITDEQCRRNRRKGLFSCSKCTQRVDSQDSAEAQPNPTAELLRLRMMRGVVTGPAKAEESTLRLCKGTVRGGFPCTTSVIGDGDYCRQCLTRMSREEVHHHITEGAEVEKGICTDCKKERTIAGHGRCAKCLKTALDRGEVQKRPYTRKAIEPAVPPPAGDVPESEAPAAEVQPPAAPPLDPPTSAPVPVTFDERDRRLLQMLEESAYRNRRTLDAEILWRLDQTFDAS